MKTLKQHIKKLTKSQFIELSNMCKHSNSLYNCGLYVVNKYYEETNSYIGYNKLYHEMKNNEHYTSIPTKMGQQIIRLIDKNYMSYFSLLKQKKNGKYADNVNKPRYKKSKSEFILILPSDQISIKKNILKITRNLKIKFTYEIKGKIKQAIIKPNGNKYYTLYITYEENQICNEIKDKNKILGIDLGLNNLASCASNVGPSFIINGKPLKSYNQFYNKIKTQCKSELKICNNKYSSNKLSKLEINRNNFIHNYFNQSISKIIKFCNEYNIGKLIIGYNETWKTEINLGSKTNQSFMNIPHYTFKEKLRNKCEENGIEFILTEESHTSKCSFIDNEKLCHKKEYLGRRIKRGLYISNTGIKLNADINGSCNIIRKVIPEFKYEGIEDFIVSPMMLNLFNS